MEMRRGRSLVVVVAMTLGACTLAGGSPPTDDATVPDLIVHDAHVLTMDPEVSEASAFAVTGDRFVAVGGDEEVLALAGPDTTVIDLDGEAVTPGFIDSHSHWIGDRELYGVEEAGDAIQMALEGGWTSINEHFVNEERLDELTQLDADGDLRLRVNAYLPVNYGPDQRFGMWFSDLVAPGEVIGPRLRIAGVKFFIDACGTRSMYMTQRGDELTPSGRFHWDRQELQELVGQVHDAGWQIAAHTCGDAATDEILDALALAYGDGGNGTVSRDRLEHLVAVRDDQLRRFEELGILPSIQLTWTDSNWAPSLERVFTGDQLALMGRWRDITSRPGLHVLGSTDTPYGEDYPELSPSTVIDALSSATTRIADPGERVPPFMEAQRLDLMRAIELLTADGAYGIFAEDDLGTITPGKLADFVVLSPDPREVPLADLHDVDVALVFVGGVLEVCAPGYEGLCPTAPATSDPTMRPLSVVGCCSAILSRRPFTIGCRWSTTSPGVYG
jgi:predicted amidohydrolase YtcJ